MAQPHLRIYYGPEQSVAAEMPVETDQSMQRVTVQLSDVFPLLRDAVGSDAAPGCRISPKTKSPYHRISMKCCWPISTIAADRLLRAMTLTPENRDLDEASGDESPRRTEDLIQTIREYADKLLHDGTTARRPKNSQPDACANCVTRSRSSLPIGRTARSPYLAQRVRRRMPRRTNKRWTWAAKWRPATGWSSPARPAGSWKPATAARAAITPWGSTSCCRSSRRRIQSSPATPSWST